MTPDPFYNIVLLSVFAAAAGAVILVSLITAPYGRHERDGWGPGIPMRIGWVVLELPSVVVFAWCYWQGPRAAEALPLVFFALWEMHYLHRTFIYPLRIRVRPGSSYRLVVVALGLVFNSANGYLNGTMLSTWSYHLDSAWLTDPRFAVGLVLFGAGFALALHSDALLRSLRAPGETGYRIPRGGAFELVSCPNYLGELLQWLGFAVATWSLAGLSFFVFTAANLGPRAVQNHRWYREQFEDYPAERKAILPFLL